MNEEIKYLSNWEDSYEKRIQEGFHNDRQIWPDIVTLPSSVKLAKLEVGGVVLTTNTCPLQLSLAVDTINWMADLNQRGLRKFTEERIHKFYYWHKRSGYEFMQWRKLSGINLES